MFITKDCGGPYMKDFKHGMLLAFSIFFLLIGILGIGNVQFFNSSVGLEIIQIVLGIGGLLYTLRRPKGV